MLELYQFESCPYCKRVREKLEELGISYISHPVSYHNPEARERLKKLTDTTMVPYLVDNDKDRTMHESEDIIAYLEKNYGRK